MQRVKYEPVIQGIKYEPIIEGVKYEPVIQGFKKLIMQDVKYPEEDKLYPNS